MVNRIIQIYRCLFPRTRVFRAFRTLRTFRALLFRVFLRPPEVGIRSFEGFPIPPGQETTKGLVGILL